MLKSLALLSVFLSVAQAHVPAPGKAPNSGTYSNTPLQANPDSGNNPTLPLLPADPPGAEADFANLRFRCA